MCAAPDGEGGKSVAFRLQGLQTAVFFEGAVHTVAALLRRADVRRIAGHTAVRDGAGAVSHFAPDEEYRGLRYFVPDEEQGELTVMKLGQMANDLAVAGDVEADPSVADDYRSRSAKANVLVLVQRLERDAADPSTLRPSRPISTLSRDLTISSYQPMEVGCEYGSGYWESV